MEKFLGIEYTEGKEREDFLETNCDAIESVSYTRRFTTGELLKKKDELSEVAIQINSTGSSSNFKSLPVNFLIVPWGSVIASPE